MELSALLNALVQGSEAATLAQIEPRPAQPGTALGQSGLPLSVPPELSTTDPPALHLGDSLAPNGSRPTGPAVSAPPGSGQSGVNTTQSPGAAVPGQPDAEPAYQRVSTATFASGPVAARTGPVMPVQPRSALGGSSGLGASADVYYGSSTPASASLLSQSGIGAYIHLLNALAENETDAKSASLLTDRLGSASAALRTSYSVAVSALPAPLQQKDWGFSISNGVLEFTAGKDALSAQDLAELQKAFAAANVETSAREVAVAITSIEAQRQSGVDLGSLALGRLEADKTNSSTIVNLRAYVTSTVPGGTYRPNVPHPEAHPDIPPMLGGMDLRNLVSARPNFFRANGSVSVDAPHEETEVQTNEELGSLRGQCSCGEVRFTVENAFEYAFYCHCSRCRLRTGSAFAAIAGIGVDKVQVTAGSDHLLLEGECADGYGARCSRCHSFLFAATRERRYMHISLGVLSGTPNRLPDHHIYVGSKAPWFEITDGLPRYDELPEPQPG